MGFKSRLSVRPSTIASPSPRTHVFGTAERGAISLLAFVLHAFFLVYLVIFGGVYFIVPEYQAQILHTYYPRVQAIMCFLLALLHARGLLNIVCPAACVNTSIDIFDPNVTPTTLVGKLMHGYTRCFSRYGLFGLHGRLYDARVAAKQLLHVPSHAIQVYQLSVYITDPRAVAVSGVVLAVTCVVVSACSFSKRDIVRRWGPPLVDSICGFVLCGGVPLVFLARIMINYYFAGDSTIIKDRVWLNAMVMLGRAVSITSPLEMLSTVVLYSLLFVSLRTLHADVHIRHGDFAAHHLLYGPKLDELALGGWHDTHTVVRRVKYMHLVLSVAAAAFFCGVTASSMARATCFEGCLLHTAPWFATACTCLMVHHNCVLHPTKDLEAYIATTLPSVFDLALVQCDLPTGLSRGLLHQLTNLYRLDLRQTNTMSWPLAPSDLPPSLVVLTLQDQVLPALPAPLAYIAYHLHYIILVNVFFTTPMDFPAYDNLYMFYATNASLTYAPPFLLNMSTLQEIGLDQNRLTAFPTEVASLPHLEFLSLMANDITSIPPSFLTRFPPTLTTVYLDGNPIDALPLDMDIHLLLSKRLRIHDTPLCTRLRAIAAAASSTSLVASLPPLEQHIVAHIDAICSANCAAGCPADFVGNGVCDAACLVPTCDYDAPAAAFAAVGSQASDCFDVLTGWEPSGPQ
ncbi:Aste57867_637 [Aphanomyces stellatus]|uniref:Aste57867_637 protein n=1 Tax=Aphanomyces stellatus TaxID=120398 RepID=A0A485K340_9STRA|nr:hypothetical protein As57867_000636 [Aphanomyces stellatus]VFT77862.1 Aste57867_637 [Aphanomyces stellatus]